MYGVRRERVRHLKGRGEGGGALDKRVTRTSHRVMYVHMEGKAGVHRSPCIPGTTWGLGIVSPNVARDKRQLVGCPCSPCTLCFIIADRR